MGQQRRAWQTSAQFWDGRSSCRQSFSHLMCGGSLLANGKARAAHPLLRCLPALVVSFWVFVLWLGLRVWHSFTVFNMKTDLQHQHSSRKQGPIEIVADYGDLCGEGPLWDDQKQILYWTDIDGKKFYRYFWKERRHELVHDKSTDRPCRKAVVLWYQQLRNLAMGSANKTNTAG